MEEKVFKEELRKSAEVIGVILDNHMLNKFYDNRVE